MYVATPIFLFLLLLLLNMFLFNVFAFSLDYFAELPKVVVVVVDPLLLLCYDCEVSC